MSLSKKIILGVTLLGLILFSSYFFLTIDEIEEVESSFHHSNWLSDSGQSDVMELLSTKEDSLVLSKLQELKFNFSKNSQNFIGFYYARNRCVSSSEELYRWNFQTDYVTKLHRDSSIERYGEVELVGYTQKEVSLITYNLNSTSLFIFFKNPKDLTFSKLNNRIKAFGNPGCSKGSEVLSRN